MIEVHQWPAEFLHRMRATDIPATRSSDDDEDDDDDDERDKDGNDDEQDDDDEHEYNGYSE